MSAADGVKPPARNPMRRKIAGVGVGLILLATVTAGIWLWLAWTSHWDAGSSSRSQVVRFPSGSSLTAVADTLAARGLLRRPWLFRLGARVTGDDRRLKAGRYELESGLPPRELLRRLVDGRVLSVALTLPEGANVEEMARIVSGLFGGTPERFIAVADSLVRRRLSEDGWFESAASLARHDSILAVEAAAGRPAHWSEGYLAPETYHFVEGVEPVTVAQALVDLGFARAESLLAATGPDIVRLGLDRHDLVTLASIIEAEARLPEERELISAVYVNRLVAGWRLEADPCVAYLLRKKGERLFYRDLETDSAWNTYRHRGLPPGPIGNPGTLALAAAARPDTACAAMFFVADGEGGHVFSRTRAEHERAVARYRLVKRRAGR